jgi:hypothetical protein
MAKKKNEEKKEAVKKTTDHETNDSKPCTEELPCNLSDAEINDKALKLASLHQQKTEVEEKKKTAMDEFKAKLKKIDGDIHYLSNMINSGKESRNVQCRLEYRWAEGKKILIRLDTGEIVSEEVIPDFERQQHVNFVERENEMPAEDELEESPEDDEESEREEDSPIGTENNAGEPEEESTEETEPAPTQEESGDEVQDDAPPCFGDYDPRDDACQGCAESQDCEIQANPTKENDETEPQGEPAEEEPAKKEHKYKCRQCEGFFDEPKDNGDEEDTTSCPLCQANNWF